jgi:hypothetical protein
MQTVLDWLQGKKTYITAILLIIFNMGVALKLWNPDNVTWTAIDTILAAFGLAFLRSGINTTQTIPPPPFPPPPGESVKPEEKVK